MASPRWLQNESLVWSPLATGYGSGTPSEEVKLRRSRPFGTNGFSDPHGRQTFEKDPKTFCEYLWRTWSPEWRFTREGV